MSGSSDTSQPADRVRFQTLIEGAGTCSAAVANAVANCPMFMPETTALLLDLPTPATFAQGAARMLFRLANGPH